MNMLYRLFSRYKHFFLLLLFIPLQMYFFYDEKTVRPRYYMFSRLDAYIPFVKQFIIPYFFWYVYVFGAFIFLGFTSRKNFIRLFLFISIGMLISCTIYLIFPNGQNLRPAIAATDPYLSTIKYLYSIDTPTDVAPSIHVLNSIAVHLALVSCPAIRKRWYARMASFAAAFAISVSTVFVKQHSVLDVMWACILSFILYICIYLIPKMVYSKNVGVDKSDNVIAE